MDANPNMSFGENSYRDIAVNSSEDQDQYNQNTVAPSVATMGVASIRDNQSAQSAISLMQASIQSTLETSFTAMSTQLDKVSNIVMQIRKGLGESYVQTPEATIRIPEKNNMTIINTIAMIKIKTNSIRYVASYFLFHHFSVIILIVFS